jgi:hypothetical protein
MNGLFSICCPRCGREIAMDAAGNGFCAACQLAFLHRFGQLIPLPGPGVEAPSDAPHVTT